LQCFIGTQDNFCGSGGGPCASCSPTANGGHCAANPGNNGGRCDIGPLCDSSNCAGCCEGDVCAVGRQDVACGGSGAACQDCSADAGFCVNIETPSSTHVGCGYDCPVGFPTPVLCTTFCATPDDCGPTSSFVH
jgi:hypothetical protein